MDKRQQWIVGTIVVVAMAVIATVVYVQYTAVSDRSVSKAPSISPVVPQADAVPAGPASSAEVVKGISADLATEETTVADVETMTEKKMAADEISALDGYAVIPGIVASASGSFCEGLSEMAGNVDAKLSDIRSGISQQAKRRGSATEESRNTRDENLNAVRFRQDARRVDWYAKFDDRATTNTEKSALKRFGSATDTAVETRRAAVDAAVETFRSDTDTITSEKTLSVGSVADDFQAAIDKAIASAKADCAAGKGSETVRTAFSTSISSAGDGLVAGRKLLDGRGDRIDAFAIVRDATIRKAAEVFDTTVTAEATTLDAVLTVHQ